MFISKRVGIVFSGYWRPLLLSCLAIFIFLIPTVFWGDRYIVGGDDSRLYYLFPKEYLNNFSFNIIGNNTLGGNLGYLAVSYSVPIVCLIYLIQYIVPFFNIQMVMYGLNLSFGFLFFYLFLQEFINKKTTFLFWASITASLFYIFSNYVTKTLYQHQLISIYLIAVLPGCLYLFTSGVRRRSMFFILASSLLYSLCSSTILSAPWLLPVVFTLIPFFLYFARRNGGYFWFALFLFIGSTVLFNAYWIIHYGIPLVTKTGEQNFASSLLSSTLKKQNDDVIVALTYLNRPVGQMVNFLRTSWADRQGITVFQCIGAVYVSVILLAGTVVFKVKKEIRNRYTVAVIGLLFAMLFFTPNFGDWNTRLFQLCNNVIPFFSMFRTMYDKFSLAMAFHFAFSLFVSLAILEYVRVRKRYLYSCIAILLAVTIFSAYPYILPDYRDSHYSIRIHGFNKDFNDLIGFIKKFNTSSRYLWYPMTFPAYVALSDEGNPNSFYVGLSPLQILARASDMAGFYGLATPSDPALHWKLLDLLRDGQYDAIGKIFQTQNIGYVIVNHERIPQEGYQALNGFNFIGYQTDRFRNTLIGEKIQDFGARYSLYTINKNYFSPTVFTADSSDSLSPNPNPVQFKRLFNGDYELTLETSKATYLVFLEPYNRLWELQLVSGSHTRVLKAVQTMAYSYGNAWFIDPVRIASQYPKFIQKQSDNTYVMHIRILFVPRRYTKPALYISIISMVIATLSIAYAIFKRFKNTIL